MPVNRRNIESENLPSDRGSVPLRDHPAARALALQPPERKSVAVILPIDFQPPDEAASVPSAASR